jgi:hypothetical protein
MKYRVAIIGAGQLGSRYLQGMVNCKLPLDITVIDPSEESLIRSQERWNEVISADNIHSVEFLKNYKDLNAKLIDIAIVSTNSASRADLIVEISNQMEIRYWVIEKVLAQNIEELNLILEKLESYSGAWVNTNRRMNKWYKEIIALTPKCSPISCAVSAKNWGLACNAIHFIDLIEWWSGEQLVSIQADQLAPSWHKSKRDAYWEVYGILTAHFTNGSKLTLNNTSENVPYLVTVKSEELEWNIKELDSIATRSDGKEFSFKLEYQSGEMTGRLIESILKTGKCGLPDLKTSVAQHKILISALLNDWNSKMPDKRSKLPIT